MCRPRRQPLILYSGEDRSLIFDLDKPYAEDPQGNTYYPGAVVRNGNVFVPASIVANYFGLQYSLIPNVEHGYLVWLRQPGYGLSDEEFASAATYPMAASYAQYLKSKESAQQTTPTPSVPEEDEEETPAGSGKNVYLCLEAGENTAQLLDVLDKAGEKASFFCSLEFLWTQGDLLRRMSASGHTAGIQVDGEDSRSVTQQLHEGNEALWRAACTKTRLAYLENGDSADLQAAQEDGFRCIYPDLDRRILQPVRHRTGRGAAGANCRPARQCDGMAGGERECRRTECLFGTGAGGGGPVSAGDGDDLSLLFTENSTYPVRMGYNE